MDRLTSVEGSVTENARVLYKGQAEMGEAMDRCKKQIWRVEDAQVQILYRACAVPCVTANLA